MTGLDRARIAIAVAVVGVFVFSAIVGALTQNYTEIGIVMPLMMLVGAFFFGFTREHKRLQNGDDEDR